MGFGQVLWSLLIIFFMVMFFMVFFMVVMDLFADKGLGGGKKAVWIIFLLIFPPITVLVYLIARGNSMAERRQAQMQAADEAQKAYIQNAVGSVSPADQIASAKALLDAGTISQEEFDQLKAKALASG
ncbi:MAG: SHOCT domain-containing protein [Actinomycetota bacterium]|jgi:ABC-type multidrug transport system fused ATPase/permease subunit